MSPAFKCRIRAGIFGFMAAVNIYSLPITYKSGVMTDKPFVMKLWKLNAGLLALAGVGMAAAVRDERNERKKRPSITPAVQ